MISIISFIGLNYKKPSFKPINYTKRKNLSTSDKKFVASNQKWKCKKCYALLDHTYEIDHIEPIFKGGSDEIENLQALCRNCHGIKTYNDINS